MEALAERIAKGHGIVNAFVAEIGLPPAFRSIWHYIMQTRGAQLDVLAMRTGADAASMQKQLHAMEPRGWGRRMPGWLVHFLEI